ncbi:MAG TPA: DUF2795 domain-containing protein [Chloroflexota bacterium]|nr:DUF2795 domain-containing protein [Chloroflexota bacterium]
MTDTQHDVEAFLAHVVFPTTKEEIINGLLVGDAPGRMIVLVERLPQDRYESPDGLRRDLEEVSRVHTAEVAPARSFDDFLALVIRHVGDIQHVTKDAFNRVAAHVVQIAEEQGGLDSGGAQSMLRRLEAAFADLRESMSEVYDDRAPIDPHKDLPRVAGS